jgi:beta-galactosidase/beta-glucuronidase
VVTLSGGGYQYSLAVNGEPTVVRGMGYNPWYAKLPVDERRPRYARDFAAMHDIGVNTVEGWFQDQFDEITLDEAHRNGLGVILPFELNQDYDYGDPAVQARFRAQITDWVLRYRDNPALLMWGPGNEVMHRLIFPTAVQGKRDPAQEKRADDFAAFYVQLIDLIHQLDPDHPVIYRDAEDLYFARLRQALLKDGQRRPWFVYGTNVYTQRLAAVIENWPNQGLDAPLLVSEFSPGGVGPAERPRMLGWYWSTIRAHPERVLGGVVYTWTTGGPEDLDRVFGLTDADGKPVDGSLAALRALFRSGDGSAGGS